MNAEATRGTPIAPGTASREQWKALELVIPQGGVEVVVRHEGLHCGAVRRIVRSDFMVMGTFEKDGMTVVMYKHGETRRYLNISLDHTGKPRFWTYMPGAVYQEVHEKDALEWVAS